MWDRETVESGSPKLRELKDVSLACVNTATLEIKRDFRSAIKIFALDGGSLLTYDADGKWTHVTDGEKNRDAEGLKGELMGKLEKRIAALGNDDPVSVNDRAFLEAISGE